MFTRNGIFRISGDTLSTFRRDTLTGTGGAHNRAAVTSAGDIVGWLDTANIVRVTNGVEIKEISKPIRSDIETINHASADLTFWDDGIRHWLVLMDGGANRVRIYDFDHEFWYPPWEITTPTAMGIGETADGTHLLFLGRTDGSTNQALRMNPANFQDDSTSYTGSITTSLMNLTVPDNPFQTGSVQHVIVERNNATVTTVNRLFDEDPKTGTFTDITANVKDPPYRPSAGSTLQEQWYDDREASGRRAAISMTWSAGTVEFEVHSMSVGYMVNR